MKCQRGNHKITSFFAPPSKRAIPDGATSASADRGTTHDGATSTSGDLATDTRDGATGSSADSSTTEPIADSVPRPRGRRTDDASKHRIGYAENGSTTTHGCSTCRVRGCIVSIVVNLTPEIAKTSPRYGT
jgi:hypothetical protein